MCLKNKAFCWMGERGVWLGGGGEGEKKPAEGAAGRPLGTWESGLRSVFLLAALEPVRALRAWHDQRALEEWVWPR